MVGSGALTSSFMGGGWHCQIVQSPFIQRQAWEKRNRASWEWVHVTGNDNCLPDLFNAVGKSHTPPCQWGGEILGVLATFGRLAREAAQPSKPGSLCRRRTRWGHFCSLRMIRGGERKQIFWRRPLLQVNSTHDVGEKNSVPGDCPARWPDYLNTPTISFVESCNINNMESALVSSFLYLKAS